MKVIPPGSTIGILGGGQLARMTAMAAARLGYKCHIFCADKDEPAVSVAAAHTIAAFDDRKALENFAKSVDVVTYDWENIPVAAVETVNAQTPVYPSADALRVAQDRGAEKNFARQCGIGTADFKLVNRAAELEKALEQFPLPAILKSTRMGYDGKGQVKIMPGTDAASAWKEMGGEAGILECFVEFACEVSVIVARRADGAVASYPVVENIHKNHILAETHAPARVNEVAAGEASHLARRLAEKLDIVGLLAVEMFVLNRPDAEGRSVLMNEMAPRPHNSGHWTIDACPVSQFEQLVRAICGLPLGSTAPHSRAVMHNLLGADIERWPQLSKESNACLHIYGKKTAKPGRKMGHVTYLKDAW